MFFFSLYRDHRDLHSFPTRRSSDLYDKVVGVANQLCLGPLRRSIPPFKQVVKPVQVDVGQQRTEHASLRSASVVDRKSTRLNSSHANISYAVFCLKKKITAIHTTKI